MSSGENNDRVSVTFTGPASDNQVFVVQRHARYPDILAAPTLETIVGALEAKYGVPSYNTRGFVEMNTLELIWTFKAGEQSSCQGLGGQGGETGARSEPARCSMTPGSSPTSRQKH